MNQQTELDKETLIETLKQIHFYELIPKHIKGSVTELNAFKFYKITVDDFLNLVTNN